MTRRNRDSWPRTNDTRAPETPSPSRRRDAVEVDLEVRDRAADLERLRDIVYRLSGFDLELLSDTDDGACDDCGRRGTRWRFVALDLCGKCAGSRVAAHRMVSRE